MCIGVYVEAYYPQFGQTWWVGVWGLIYISCWLAGMEAMRRLSLNGSDRFGRTITAVVMVTLALADLSNVWQLVAPAYKPFLFMALDICWPVSHVLMLAVGVATLRANKLSGYHAWLPVAMGLWFPLTIAVSKTLIVLHFSNIYSLIVWVLMAITLIREARLQRFLGEECQVYDSAFLP
jgi:membrane-associated HD superfamily phosphohydrolase